MNELESLRQLTLAVEKAGADVASGYQEYVQLAFAIATDCGEAGREYFHRICRMSSKYQQAHAERFYTEAINTKRGDVHLGTAFHLAECAGVDTKNALNALNAAPPCAHTHTHAYYKEPELPTTNAEELLEGSDPRQPLPLFTPVDWPPLLQLIMSYATSDAQRDIMLLGALTTLGASMERHVRCHYAGKMQSPCLQTFVVAPPASGKGVLTLIRLLAEPIHDKLRQQSDEKLKNFKKEKLAFDAMGKEKITKEIPQMPPNKMFLISGNNSGTGILQNIMDADGTGFICEAEADTLSTAIGSEYGQWSDTLRKCFDHDRLSYNRRTDHEYREVKKTFISVLLSGTPAQVKPLIPSAENGLFSRQIFYYMPGIKHWVSQFDKSEIDLEAVFTALGKQWEKRLEQLKSHGLHTLLLSDSQKEEFNLKFEQLFHRSNIANGNEMSSSVARLAINICRIMSVVAVLRILQNENPYLTDLPDDFHFTPDPETPADNITDGIITRWSFTISEADFNAVMQLAIPLYRHATHILSFLPATELNHRPNADRDNFFEALGTQFTRAQVLEKAETMGIKPNTAVSWLDRLKKRGIVESVNQGSYIRAQRVWAQGATALSALSAFPESDEPKNPPADSSEKSSDDAENLPF